MSKDGSEPSKILPMLLSPAPRRPYASPSLTPNGSKRAYSSRSGESLQLLKRSTTGGLADDSDATNEEADEQSQKLVVYFVLMLFFALGNRIFGRLQVYPMHNYPIFMNIILVAIYIPACFIYILPVQWFTNIITKGQTEIPKYKFFIMGWYDSISSLLQVYALNYIHSSSLTVLVQQSAIPISMLISKISLNSQYTTAQYTGASVVMLGIVVVIIPQITGGGEDEDSKDADPHRNTISNDAFMQLVWLLVLIISCVPMCLSSVYKEKALGEIDVDVTYLNGWVAIFQFIISIPLCIPSSQVQGMPLSSIIPNVMDGFKCWAGINSITEDNNPLDQPLDQCSSAPLYTTAYLIFNLVYNFLTVVVLKYGSANVLWLASTLIVPLSDIAFSLKFIPGSQPMTAMDLVGLFVIMAGLIIYRFFEQMVAVWNRLLGKELNKEELLQAKIRRRISRKQERKQARYFGLNQIESLQTLMDSRVQRAQMQQLMRSPRIIRESYLMKIGVDPSPKLTVRKTVQQSPIIGAGVLSPTEMRQQRTLGGKTYSIVGSRQQVGAPPSPLLQRGGSLVGLPERRGSLSEPKLDHVAEENGLSNYVEEANVNRSYGSIPNHETKSVEALPLDV